MNLRQNILTTLAYYDVLDLPLTAEEIFNRLVNLWHLGTQNKDDVFDLNSVKKTLDQLILDKIVGCETSHYFLFEREYLIPLRQRHQEIATRKWQKTKMAIWCLKFIPYIKAIFGSGSLAINNTDELSDLDVLVVVKHGRIWLARLFIMFALSIIGMRRRGFDKLAPNKICLNHYITDSSLLIPFKSLYNAQTYSNLVPIYVRDGELIKNFKKENSWVLDFTYNWNLDIKVLIKTGLAEKIISFFEKIFDATLANSLEALARNYQQKRIASNPLVGESGGRIMFSDKNLEFHPHSTETSIIKSYNNNLTKLGIPELAIEKDSGLVK